MGEDHRGGGNKEDQSHTCIQHIIEEQYTEWGGSAEQAPACHMVACPASALAGVELGLMGLRRLGSLSQAGGVLGRKAPASMEQSLRTKV